LANTFFAQKCYGLWHAIVAMLSDGAAVYRRTLTYSFARSNSPKSQC